MERQIRIFDQILGFLFLQVDVFWIFWHAWDDVWGIVWDFLDGFSYSFGVFFGRFCRHFRGNFRGWFLFRQIFFQVDFFPYNIVGPAGPPGTDGRTKKDLNNFFLLFLIFLQFFIVFHCFSLFFLAFPRISYGFLQDLVGQFKLNKEQLRNTQDPLPVPGHWKLRSSRAYSHVKGNGHIFWQRGPLKWLIGN